MQGQPTPAAHLEGLAPPTEDRPADPSRAWAPTVRTLLRRPLSKIAALRGYLLLAAWVALVVIWGATCAGLWMSGKPYYSLLAAGDVALLAVLYLAEGMELAVTDLLDKDPEQASNPTARRLLQDIQRRSVFFYANRQLFVVVVITIMNLTLLYPWIYVPGLGEVANMTVRSGFNFLLTTFTVLWFAQVIPKRLAVINSERFLMHSRPVWALIRAAGLFGLTTPTELVVPVITRRTGFRNGRQLAPSRIVQYSNQARLYGFSVDRISTTIRLGRQGRATVRKRLLVLLLHGNHGETHGSLVTSFPLPKPPTVRVLGLFRGRVPERIESLAADLDGVFDDDASRGHSHLTALPPSAWRHGIAVSSVASPANPSTAATYWIIQGDGLPEALGRGKEGGPDTMAAILYEVDVELPPGSFGGHGGAWSEAIDLPCRRLAFDVQPGSPRVDVVADQLTARLSNSSTTLDEESARLSAGLGNEERPYLVSYPLQGVTYTLHWHTT